MEQNHDNARCNVNADEIVEKLTKLNRLCVTSVATFLNNFIKIYHVNFAVKQKQRLRLIVKAKK